MSKYKKSLLYIYLTLLVIACIACNREAQQHTPQPCPLNKQPQISVTAEKPVTHVVIDNKALAAFTKRKVRTVYCVAMGVSWGGIIVDPTVIVGMPKTLNDYDKFETNGIDVYMKKGTNTITGTVTITAENAFWQDMFIVKGIAQ